MLSFNPEAQLLVIKREHQERIDKAARARLIAQAGGNRHRWLDFAWLVNGPAKAIQGWLGAKSGASARPLPRRPLTAGSARPPL